MVSSVYLPYCIMGVSSGYIYRGCTQRTRKKLRRPLYIPSFRRSSICAIDLGDVPRVPTPQNSPRCRIRPNYCLHVCYSTPVLIYATGTADRISPRNAKEAYYDMDVQLNTRKL